MRERKNIKPKKKENCLEKMIARKLRMRKKEGKEPLLLEKRKRERKRASHSVERKLIHTERLKRKKNKFNSKKQKQRRNIAQKQRRRKIEIERRKKRKRASFPAIASAAPGIGRHPRRAAWRER